MTPSTDNISPQTNPLIKFNPVIKLIKTMPMKKEPKKNFAGLSISPFSVITIVMDRNPINQPMKKKIPIEFKIDSNGYGRFRAL